MAPSPIGGTLAGDRHQKTTVIALPSAENVWM